MAARRGSAWDRAYDDRGMRRKPTRRGASSRGPTRALGKALILLRRDFIQRRCDLGPISASGEWPHACDRGIALRCSSASSAHCHRARENAHGGAPRGRAISGRPRRVHAQAFVPTWRSRVATLVAMLDRLVRSTHKQRQTALKIAAPKAHQRIARHHSPSAGHKGGSRQAGRDFACSWAGPKN